MNDYDMNIHTNPDARAWAKFFTEKYKVWSEDGVESDSEALMTAWFANAMMAMHDHLVLKGNPINGDHAQYLIDKENGVEEQATEPVELHSCPYAEELYGNYDKMCDCDEEQTRQCLMDI